VVGSGRSSVGSGVVARGPQQRAGTGKEPTKPVGRCFHHGDPNGLGDRQTARVEGEAHHAGEAYLEIVDEFGRGR